MKILKIFLASILAFCFAACGFWQAEQNTNSNAPAISEELETGIPFDSREPDAFQTEIVVTNFLAGEKTQKIYFVAKSGNKFLTVFNRGEKSEHSIISDGAKTVFLDKANKTFREDQNAANGNSAPDETLEFLTTEWLNRKTGASFEKLTTENNLTNYRVRFAESNASEIIVTYDESLKMPVKQEFYSIADEQRTLTMTVELKNFQTSADENLFVLPQDYKRAETK